MSRHQCYRFVYSSSATVYGAPEEIPIPETTPLSAESCYGRTKQICEMIIKDVCDSAPTKWRAIALRYFNPAGGGPPALS
jgi:UDP-glucose 4-epimerase